MKNIRNIFIILLLTLLSIDAFALPNKQQTVSSLFKILDGHEFVWTSTNPVTIIYSYRYDFNSDILIQRKDRYKAGNLIAYSEKYLPIKNINISSYSIGNNHLTVYLENEIPDTDYKPDGSVRKEYWQGLIELEPNKTAIKSNSDIKYEIETIFKRLVFIVNNTENVTRHSYNPIKLGEALGQYMGSYEYLNILKNSECGYLVKKKYDVIKLINEAKPYMSDEQYRATVQHYNGDAWKNTINQHKEMINNTFQAYKKDGIDTKSACGLYIGQFMSTLKNIEDKWKDSIKLYGLK